MKAIVRIEKLRSDKCKHIIVRNLNRIMDIKILDIDLENKTLSFAYESGISLEKVKKELFRIGYPFDQLRKKKLYQRCQFKI